MTEKTEKINKCRAIVVSCIDYRLRKHILKWTSATLDDGGYDRVALAGGVKNLPFVLEQIALSVKLHHIDEVYLINHEDCGAYGEEGTFAKHKKDLLFAKKIIRQKLPKLEIFLYYLKLDGEFIRI